MEHEPPEIPTINERQKADFFNLPQLPNITAHAPSAEDSENTPQFVNGQSF